MKITIEFIDHTKQRYPTAGDWQFAPNGDLKIRISETGDKRFNLCVAVHELVEAIVCDMDGINQSTVDKFDMDYEDKREDGDETEPGDSPKAPYFKQHFLATTLERQLAIALDVDWIEYEKTLLAL